jgi:activator of HSP90 ATPase
MAIHQDIVINGTPKAVYDILTSSKKFATMTGGREAKISKDEGGAISMFGGAIQGRNVELIPGKRVVQAWRAGDWKQGTYSVVRFELVADGAKTKLSFDQSGHPADAQPHLESGWHKMYWEPMNAMLSSA